MRGTQFQRTRCGWQRSLQASSPLPCAGTEGAIDGNSERSPQRGYRSMKSLLRRLEKLEGSAAGLLEGPWLWPVRAAAGKKRTMEAMLPEERVLLAESFGSHDTDGVNELGRS